MTERGNGMDLIDYIKRHRAFSAETFGPGDRRAGVLAHIASELEEVRAEEDDLKLLEEWCDVIILAIDGAWRSGASAEAIAGMLDAKLAKNKARTWPDWRGVPDGQPIEHVR